MPVASSVDKSRKKGFALVLALSLLSLVFLLVVSLVSLVGTDLSLSEARKDRILAQVHARMGMKIAIGEIQKHLGPDMRISATADLLDERVESGREFVSNAYNNSPTQTDDIDLDENGRIETIPFGQRYWTGVWKHRARAMSAGSKKGTKPLPENRETGNSVDKAEDGGTNVMLDSSFDPHPAVEVAWLVSGNEGHTKNLFLGSSKQSFDEYVGIPDGNIWDATQSSEGYGRNFFKGGIYGKFENAWEDYEEAINSSKMSEYDHPILALNESEEDTTWILKAPVLKDGFIEDGENPDSWKENLKAEPIRVRKTEISEIRESVNTETINKVGAYAYWVGDEGVKTKVNLDFDFLDKLVTSKDLLERDKITVAMNPNIGKKPDNSMDAGFDFNLDLLDSVSLLPEGFESPLHRVISPNFLAELIKGAGEGDSLAINKAAAHFHSVTTDSFGVLSDVRTGGLKRDLSSAFAMDSVSDDNKWDLDSENDEWSIDFEGYIYRDRIHCLKSVPMKEDVKENEWYVSDDESTINDYNAILAGPRWSVLGGYHNLYLDNSNYKDIQADHFPRMIGDNSLVFNSSTDAPPNSPNPFWGDDFSILLARFNWFEEISTRPEPKTHPIQPVLTEIKYSHIPVWNNDQIALAIYPSVALWNPYNKEIKISELFLELPFRVTMKIMNPKEYDLWRKWWMYKYEVPADGEQPTTANAPDLSSLIHFEDLNGNGRMDPGEPSFNATHTLTTPSQPLDHNRVLENGFDDLEHYSGLMKSSWNWERRQFFVSSDVADEDGYPQPQRNRHLLLHIKDISLKPGEKLHYVVEENGFIDYTNPPDAGSATEFVPVDLVQGDEENLNALVYNSSGPDFPKNIPPTDPVSLRFWLSGIQGIHPQAMESFGPYAGERTPNSFSRPKGIIMYYEDPTGVSFQNRKVAFKLNKGFSIWFGGQNNDFLQANQIPSLYDFNTASLDDFNPELKAKYMPGNGFRIRFKLPGLADGVVKEQYNLRALIHSYQDGFGDNWQSEEFVFTDNSNFNVETNIFGNEFAQDNLTINGIDFSPTRYHHFYTTPIKPNLSYSLFLDEMKETGNLPAPSEVDFNKDWIMPRALTTTSTVGFFHDSNEEHGKMDGDDEAVLFDLPKDPLLSIFQFRHANLNNYVHGPSYSMGNSYASTQVSRHKTWARVRALRFAPSSELGMNIQDNIADAKALTLAGFPGNVFSWKNRNDKYGAVRETTAQNEHQNTTTDHSFYINRALVDGYFLTGVATSQSSNAQDCKEKEESLFGPGYSYLPYRNPRLYPYYRENEWQKTSYSNLSKKINSAEDDVFLYQTKAADLLINGAFNINSTSVDAWFSQLSSLRGQSIAHPDISVSSDETPFPRFTDYSKDNSWKVLGSLKEDENSWNVLRTLSDQDISELAKEMVKQVKLRGPFLSLSDFTNRRLQRTKANRLVQHFSKWEEKSPESRSSVLGLRGAVQAAIAEAGLNDAEGLISSPEPFLVVIPEERYDAQTWDSNYFNYPFREPDTMGYISSKFGIHAVSKDIEDDGIAYLHPAFKNYKYYNYNSDMPETLVLEEQKWGRGIYDSVTTNPPFGSEPLNIPTKSNIRIEYGLEIYEDAFSVGEAPENMLAVENVATAANKPGWLMQSDVLSPLAPVITARSDTFMVRVMGEHSENNQTNSSKAWIELTVQRIPDYVKPDIDAPHHRPHEPFEDRNFNGYWDSGPSAEHWLDLNQNSWDTDGGYLSDAYPDLPGSPIGKDWYADGLASDLPLEVDPDEEDSSAPYSRLGINQRFGRKFKIIKFRWLKEQDV